MTQNSRALAALIALGAAWLVVRAKAEAPAPPEPVGTTELGPLSYPMGTKPYPEPYPDAPREEGLQPYPRGGYFVPDEDAKNLDPWTWRGPDAAESAGISPGLLM